VVSLAHVTKNKTTEETKMNKPSVISKSSNMRNKAKEANVDHYKRKDATLLSC